MAALAILKIIVLSVFFSNAALADPVQFTAEPDRVQIGLDDSVSIKMTITTEGAKAGGDPTFKAPDFELVNEFNSSFIQSYYENGRFGMRNSQQSTKVLRPLKQGTLRIREIAVNIQGQVHRAPDITVVVVGAGANTPPPPGYGGGGLGLKGAGKRTLRPTVWLRAELDKSKVYKGEQIIVSYYLYRRVKLFNIQIDKFPVLTGFLREDLEMPAMGQHLDTERVVLDGVAYDRSLLLRYAAYPLQSGKLQIDSVSMKYNYYANSNGAFDDDNNDPFTNFFQQLSPRSGNEKSSSVTVEVMPLPENGRPSSFSGGVGDFNVTSAVDKIEVHANEALSLTVNIEGRGNVAAIGEPKASWPQDVELYDSKARTKSSRSGVGEKIFEFLLIPRVQGSLTLPPLEFSFFDSAKNIYVTRTTEPIAISVLPPLAGSGAIPPLARSMVNQPGSNADKRGSSPGVQGANLNLRPLKVPLNVSDQAPDSLNSSAIWHWLYLLASVAFIFFGVLIGYDFIKTGSGKIKSARETKARAYAKSWDHLREKGKAALRGASWKDVAEAYELLTSVLVDELERAYPIGVKALPRSELKQLLVEERNFSLELWERIEKIFEFAEMVRFASSAGVVAEGKARAELLSLVQEGELIAKGLSALK